MPIFDRYSWRTHLYTADETDRINDPEKYNYDQAQYDEFVASLGAKIASRQAADERSGMEGVGRGEEASPQEPDVYMRKGGTPVFAQASEEELARTRQKVIDDYGFDPLQIAREEGVDPYLFLRIMHRESRGDASSVSAKGAGGLMQLMPKTAAEEGVTDVHDPLQNARAGASYFRKQLLRFGNVTLALAAYNGGLGKVKKYRGVPPFAETREFIARIMGGSPEELELEFRKVYKSFPVVDYNLSGNSEGTYPFGKPPRLRPEAGDPTTPNLQQVMTLGELLRAATEPVRPRLRPEAGDPEPELVRPRLRPEAGDPEPESVRPRLREGIGAAFYKQYAPYAYKEEAAKNMALKGIGSLATTAFPPMV